MKIITYRKSKSLEFLSLLWQSDTVFLCPLQQE